MAQPLHYTLTLSGAAQDLLDAVSIGEPAGGRNDPPLREVELQADGANAAAVFVGGAGVSSTNYGKRIPPATAGLPAIGSEVHFGPYDSGPLKLSGIFVIGTANEKVHVLAVPW